MSWLEGFELRQSGWYFMGRTDDPDWLNGGPRSPLCIFQFGDSFYANYGDGTMQDVITMDDEVRWFGPILSPVPGVLADADWINVLDFDIKEMVFETKKKE